MSSQRATLKMVILQTGQTTVWAYTTTRTKRGCASSVLSRQALGNERSPAVKVLSIRSAGAASGRHIPKVMRSEFDESETFSQAGSIRRDRDRANALLRSIWQSVSGPRDC